MVGRVGQRRWLTASVALVVMVVLVPRALSASAVVSSVPGRSLGLAADRGTLVWVLERPSSATCRLSVVVIDVASGARQQLAGLTGRRVPGKPISVCRMCTPRLVAVLLCGRWVREMTVDRQRVFSATISSHVEAVVGEVTRTVGSGGDYLTGLAASGSTAVYGEVAVAPVDAECQTTAQHCLFAATGGEVRAVSGGTSHQLSAVPAVLLAASPTRVALVEPDASPSEDPRPHTAPGDTVQVRSAATGSLITSFAPTGRVEGDRVLSRGGGAARNVPATGLIGCRSGLRTGVRHFANGG